MNLAFQHVFVFLSCRHAQKLANLLVEYHANGGGGSWHANRYTSGQLSFEGSWILLLNNNGMKLVPITDCSDSKWVAQLSRKCPYCPEFVSMICSGPVVRSHQTNLIWINGHMPSDNLVEQSQSKVPPAVFKVTPAKIMQHLGHTGCCPVIPFNKPHRTPL